MEGNLKLRERRNRYNIRINIINGIAAAIVLNLVDPYFAKFAERLGASDYQIAYLSSLPAFISVFVLIPGGILIESFRNKQFITGAILFAHKSFYLLLALVPFVPKAYQSWLFVILIGFMNLPGSIGNMGFQSSIGDVFDGGARGTAMGLRNRYSTIVGMIAIFASGQILTRIPKTNEETILLYQIFFIVAFVVAQGEVFSFFKFKGITSKNKDQNARFRDLLKETLKDLPKERNFLIFTACSLFFHFGWQMGWPLFNIYNVKIMKANEIWLSIFTIAMSLSSIYAYTIWARYADLKGNSMMLSMAAFGMAVTPLMYVGAPDLPIVVLINVISGVSTAGTVLILFNILLEVTPGKNRTIYIALYNTLIALSAAIAPIVGVAIKDKTSIYIAFFIVGILRFLGSVGFFMRNRYMMKY